VFLSKERHTRDNRNVRFSGTVEPARGGGHFVVVPFDVKAEFGEARPPVRGTVNGVALRTRLMVYGGVTYLGLRNDFLAETGLDLGDAVDVELERDDAPREVELPPELEAALADAQVRAAFEKLSFTHRREYAEWVAEAKRAETRERRVAQTVEKLRGA
jgi:hypothetical protein